MSVARGLLSIASIAVLAGCSWAYSTPDPDIARLERAAARAPKGPTPAAYMSLAEMYPDNPQARALVKAASRGDAKEIDRLIDAGADPNAMGAYDLSVPAWVMYYHPNKAGFRRLLERGADPNKIWYRKNQGQSSLLHFTVERSDDDEIGTDYLKMCLEIGKGNPNLEPPDHKERPIALALERFSPQAFYMLYYHGAEIDYKMRYPHQSDSLADAAAFNHNYNILLFLLRNGVHYDSAIKPELTIHDSIQMAIDYAPVTGKDNPQYMWFWRSVKFLEQHGMTFDYGIYEPPAVLDTTPPESIARPEVGGGRVVPLAAAAGVSGGADRMALNAGEAS